MPKTTSTIPAIVELRIKELIIEPSLSGRSVKELTANAKELAPKMEAAGGWEPSQPGHIVKRGGKIHLVAGFTRCAAAELAAIKVGYFVEVDDNPDSLRTACIRTNLGKPVSQFEQGRIYAGMRDGTDVTTTKEGDAIFAPMEIKDIAEEVGYSRQHVDSCLAIFEETPEIGELIAEGVVSPNIVTRARQLVKADGKRLAFLKAAVAEAKRDGKEVATMKHLDAVRPDYAPLKADAPEKPKKDAKKADAKKDTEPDEPEKEVPESTLDLGTPAAKPVPVKKVRDSMIAVLLACDDELSSVDAEKYSDALIKAGFGIVITSPL